MLLTLLVNSSTVNAQSNNEHEVFNFLVIHQTPETHAIYHETYSKEKIMSYLETDFTLDQVTFVLEPSEKLERNFSSSTFKHILSGLDAYKTMTVSDSTAFNNSIVTESEIPDFIKNGEPPPFERDSSFTNVQFFSTPLINEGKAITLSHSYSDEIPGVIIHFMVKTNNEWEYLGEGIILEKSLRK
ncbi:hypothetical protein [Gracilimonas mengyeensis]|uniref:Uncharacterized protein n=1 Tax=Gracilimonas mengyeensis TaxID=1302730 RepID=A0A521EMC7_9BACT|nr:hypothetical protein [Gracilimonas mengyeensis]SMO85077.1 hypothetical protein SAMN06265219_112158 [Gracilimonas mengyeensis]